MFVLKKIILTALIVTSAAGCTHSSSDASMLESRVHADESKPTANLPVDLAGLHIQMPEKWKLEAQSKTHDLMLDEHGEVSGDIYSIEESKEFDFQTVKPNHSEIIDEEYFDIPLGTCRLITLDADNGTAASGITGTHYHYYAVIADSSHSILLLNFSKNNKESSTKQQFIDILKGLAWEK
ncbi:hypothetical protein P9847_15310 [Paenibacillus chibensis]|uniref:Lipoprotein n=1 Tax=Paenibacillus chibensis TaxID=59846 RepID=A0ABU6PUV8_9BACL|nr:hypothetical protein [Paenibacillus chibensis]